MPIEATPREQVEVLALATKLTGAPTLAPLAGLLTVTPAQAEVAKAATRKMYKQSLYHGCGISPTFWICLLEVGAGRPSITRDSIDLALATARTKNCVPPIEGACHSWGEQESNHDVMKLAAVEAGGGSGQQAVHVQLIDRDT